ncbi:MAG: hypothetical protein M3Y48_25325 [Actinomycetota bacterium]|nr:hypothetical protein [Actinomycetota bacterium]
MAGEEAFDGLVHRGHLRCVQVALVMRGRIASGEQQRVSLTQGNLKTLSQMLDHLRARA